MLILGRPCKIQKSPKKENCTCLPFVALWELHSQQKSKEKNKFGGCFLEAESKTQKSLQHPKANQSSRLLRQKFSSYDCKSDWNQATTLQYC